MARPPRFNATYYTHDAGLRNDRKVKAIRTKFGAAGYGVFHMLLEALTDADHTALDTSGLELELLAGDFGVDASEIEALVRFGENVGYFGRNEAGLLICSELSRWLEPVFEKRNRSKNPPAAALLPQPAAETGVSVTETPQSKGKERKEKKRKEEVNSSLRSEGAATAAASEPEKKIGAEELQAESPDASASHTRGATDVATRKKTRRPRPEPGPATVTAYRLPDWATEEFTQRLEEWLVRRQNRGDCRPLQADSIQARIDELSEYDEAFCLSLFRQAKQNPHWQGLTFDNTKLKFTQHIQQLTSLQADAARQNQPIRGAQPTGAAASGAYSLAERLAAVDAAQREQKLQGVGGGVAAGAYTGQGPR